MKVINQFEKDGAQYQTIRLKSSGIFWQTATGEWVKKVIAIRDGLQLTGQYQEMATSPVHMTRLAPEFKPNPFRT
jgi:hypothetical protein